MDSSPTHDAPIGDDLSALAWVQDELRRSLEGAHKALRRFLKELEAQQGGADLDSVDPGVLRTARNQIHQGVGALELVGLPAAATVLRASEEAVQRFIAKPEKLSSKLIDDVEHASFGLLDYLTRLLAGKTISPLALFPQYRALREAAGAERVHPADLWAVDWRWRDLPADATVAPLHHDATTRGALEAQLLALMRGANPEQTAGRMSDICAGLGAGAIEPHTATSWNLAAGVFEAQAQGLLGFDVFSKRVASRLLAQFRALERGETDVSERLAQDLLFFCAQSDSPGDGRRAPRLATVRQAYSLAHHVPADYSVSPLGHFDPAIVIQARKRVAAAKEAWSAVAGGEMHRLAGLSEQFSLVGDSLKRLFPHGESFANELQSAVGQTQESRGSPPAPLAMEVATSLLYVEASLEDAEFDEPEQAERVQRLAERLAGVRQGQVPEPLEGWMEELYRRVSDRQTMGSVVQELRASLSEAEKLIDQFFRNPLDRRVLIPVPNQLSAMRGVLSVLGMDHASAALLRMRDEVDGLAATVVEPEHVAQAGVFDRLAGNLGALGFLIDMLSVQPAMAKSLFTFDADTGTLSPVMGRVAPPALPGSAPPAPVDQRLIEQAQMLALTAARGDVPVEEVSRELEWLSQEAQAADQPTLAAATQKALDAIEQAETPAGLAAAREELSDAMVDFVATASEPVGLDAEEADAGPSTRSDGSRVSRPISLDFSAADAADAAPAAAPAGEDDEMREIFLEEAREVLEGAVAAIAELAHSGAELELLTTLRRAFHTLKGSSRMVGLHAFGEAAWACEQLYNAQLGDQRPAEQPLIDFTGWALDYLGGWVDDIAAQRPPAHDAATVKTAAQALADHQASLGHEAPSDISLEFDAPEPIVPAPAPVPPQRLKSPPLEQPPLAFGFPIDMPTAADLDLGGPRADRVSAAEAPPEPAAASADAAFAAEPLPGWAREPEPAAEAGLDFELEGLGGPPAEPGVPSLADEPSLISGHVPFDNSAHALLKPFDAEATQPFTPATPSRPFAGEATEPMPYGPASFEHEATQPMPMPEIVEGPLPDLLFEGIDLDLGDPVEAAAPVVQPVEPAASVPFGFDAPAEPIPGEPPAAEPDHPTLIERADAYVAVTDTEPELVLDFSDSVFAAAPAPVGTELLPPDALADEPGELAAPHAEPATEAPIDTPASWTEPETGFLPELGPEFAPTPAETPNLATRFDFAPEPDAAAAPELPADAGAIDELSAEPPASPEPAAAQPPEPAFQFEPAAAFADDDASPSTDEDQVKVVGPLRIGIPLFNIYLNEADELSRRLAIEVAEWAMELHGPIGETPIALAHSLAGSSATVGFKDLSDLARTLEHAQARSRAIGAGTTDEARLFVDAAEEIRRLLHQFAAGFLKTPSPELLERLADHERSSALRLEAATAAAELPELSEVGEFAPEPVTLFSLDPMPEDASAAPELVMDTGQAALYAQREAEARRDVPDPEAIAEAAAAEGSTVEEAAIEQVAAGEPAEPPLAALLQAPVEAAIDPAPAPWSTDFGQLPEEPVAERPAEPVANAATEPIAEAAVEAPEESFAEPAAEAPSQTHYDPLGVAELKPLGAFPAETWQAPAASHDAAAGDDGIDDIDAVDAVDPELFPFFDEEADELIPRLAGELRGWARQPDASAPPGACMRTLHTLKGGARLAGAMRLGEMAHRLESRIEHLLAAPPVAAADVDALLTHADAIEHSFQALRQRDATPPSAAAADSEVTPAEAAPPAAPAEPVLPPLHTLLDDAPPSLLEATAHAEAASHAASPFDGTVEAPAEPAAESVAEASAEPVPAAAPAATPDTPAVAPAAPPADPAAPIDWSRFAGSTRAVRKTPERAAQAVHSAVRVRAPVLDRLVNQAGEVSITRSRIESDVGQIKASMLDLSENLERLRAQLRDIEFQAETQMSSRLEAAKAASENFDPLEIDRFTRFQELTRMMAESVNDVATVQRSLQRSVDHAEDELAAQARLTRDLQDDLLRTRMVEFEGLSDRLYRVVRQAAKETGKSVRLDIVGGSIEVDRGVLDRMTASFEHLLRNCVAHGIESPEARAAAGKDTTGTIVVALSHEGNEVGVEFRDDGAGLDLARIRAKGVAAGLLDATAATSDADLANLIFAPGFTTQEVVTELSGRGVGMDVVRSDVNAIGGRIETATAAGQGTSFKMILPLTTAVTQVVMLRCGDTTIAVPSTLVEVVRRSPQEEIDAAYANGSYTFAERALQFFWLGALLQVSPVSRDASSRTRPVVVVRSAQQRIALQVDEVMGNQEVVVKNLGPQLSGLPGLAGVTLLVSGRVTLIYNPVALATLYGDAARAATHAALHPAAGLPAAAVADEPAAPVAPLVMVVDDSLTVRRVTQRLLQREGYRVLLAKDGLDALERLAEEVPRMVLSDIEMPRMDGFDLVRNMRADARLRDLPVVMITSRIAQKHRDHAAALGVDHYLGKPYAEEDLLALVARYTREPAAAPA